MMIASADAGLDNDHDHGWIDDDDDDDGDGGDDDDGGGGGDDDDDDGDSGNDDDNACTVISAALIMACRRSRCARSWDVPASLSASCSLQWHRGRGTQAETRLVEAHRGLTRGAPKGSLQHSILVYWSQDVQHQVVWVPTLLPPSKTTRSCDTHWGMHAQLAWSALLHAVTRYRHTSVTEVHRRNAGHVQSFGGRHSFGGYYYWSSKQGCDWYGIGLIVRFARGGLQ